jgi:hypothetical protein
MTLARKLVGIADELRQESSPSEKLFRLAQRGAHSLGLAPALTINRCVIVQLTEPPKLTRALSDLVIRRAEERDVPALAAVDNRDAALFRARLGRGDMVYLGQLDGGVICHTCFHRGPTPFEEERATFAPWALEDASSFWSYDASALPEARSSGVVAKLFQVALREVFELHGGRRVRGFIHDRNHPSLILHDRLGFTVIGKVTAVGLSGVKWVRWESGGHARQWLLPRNSDFALPPAMA